MSLCIAICKNNKPCSRKKYNNFDYCKQHNNIYNVSKMSVNNTDTKIEVGAIINNTYKITNQIFENNSSKCKVYKIQNTYNNEFYILKEDITRYIENEVFIYNIINNTVGFSRLILNTSNYIIMNDVGINMMNYINLNGQLSLELIKKFGVQMVERIQSLHDMGFIHRDIKQGNFLINNDIVYLIDFGVSYQYIINNEHIDNDHRVGFKGTKKYASINALKNIPQSRRDDLEALGYLLISFIIDLPWGNLKDKNEIVNMKENIDNYDILKPFKDYICYTRLLKFDEKPDYEHLKLLLSNL